MKKLLSLMFLAVLSLGIVACGGRGSDDELECDDDEIIVDGQCVTDPDLETDPLTVAEVLETDDLTYVEFVGIVSGFDAGKRHIVIEDPDGVANVQLFRGMGYPQIQVGDEVLIRGFRTFDRSTDRVDPEELEVLSSGNPTSRDNPIVIDASELNEWTNENRVNEDILFRWYTFTNVTIVEITPTYTYIDNLYDDEPDGRGLKIGVKDTSFVAPDGLFIEGETYTFTALLYGSSDDFFDEGRDGTVLRLSVLSEDDIIHHIDEALFDYSGRSKFLVGEDAPNWANSFTVIDPEDGTIPTEDLTIEENVDMNAAGTYSITVTYENANGFERSETFEIEVMSEGSSVTEAIEADTGTEMLVEGIVIGFGLRGSTRVPLIIEDPENGNAIELWSNANYNDVEVGDRVVIYSGSTTLEKGQPRLNNHQLIKIVSTDNALTDPIVIEDLVEWANDVVENGLPIFGRYTFTAEMVDATSSGTYKYFAVCEEDERCLQFGVHQDSAVSYEWIEGNLYTVTGVIYGVSDPIDVLDNPESTTIPTIRFGIMNENDIQVDAPEVSFSGRTIFYIDEDPLNWSELFTVIDPNDGAIANEDLTITESINMTEAGTYPITISYENSNGYTITESFDITVVSEGSSVTEAIEADLGTEMLVEGIVIGYGETSTRIVPLIIEDPANGNAIEIWTSAAYNDVQVGDRIVIYSGATALEKGQPRLNNHQLIRIVSSGNALTDPIVIEDLVAWTENVVENNLPIYGRYTFTAEMVDATSSGTYKYFTVCEEDERCLQFAVHQNTVISIDWVEGDTYTVTGVIFGISDPIDVLHNPDSSTTPTIRFGIMNESDVEHITE